VVGREWRKSPKNAGLCVAYIVTTSSAQPGVLSSSHDLLDLRDHADTQRSNLI
jgi:hypothetical protein